MSLATESRNSACCQAGAGGVAHRAWSSGRHTNTDGISLNFPHHDNGVLRHVRWPSSHAALGKSYAALRNRALSNSSCHSQMSRFGSEPSPSRKHV